MLKTKEKKEYSIHQITTDCKFSLIYSSFSQHEDTVQTRNVTVQVIIRHQLWGKTNISRKTWETNNEQFIWNKQVSCNWWRWESKL